jgi:hypothetical protein
MSKWVYPPNVRLERTMRVIFCRDTPAAYILPELRPGPCLYVTSITPFASATCCSACRSLCIGGRSTRSAATSVMFQDSFMCFKSSSPRFCLRRFAGHVVLVAFPFPGHIGRVRVGSCDRTNRETVSVHPQQIPYLCMYCQSAARGGGRCCVLPISSC